MLQDKKKINTLKYLQDRYIQLCQFQLSSPGSGYAEPVHSSVLRSSPSLLPENMFREISTLETSFFRDITYLPTKDSLKF